MADAPQTAASLQTALRSFIAGDLDAARKSCSDILQAIPHQADALHLLGVMEIRGGDRRAAKDLLRRAAESPETKALYLLSYAEVCCKPTDQMQALAVTRRALAMDGNLPLAWLCLGEQLLELHEHAESKACFERALQLDPDFWRARAKLATVMCRLGDTAGAMECFQQVLRQEADNPDAIGSYAMFMLELGHHKDALILAELAITKPPDSLEHHLCAADIELQLCRYESALNRLSAVEQRWPDDLRLLVLKANLLRLVDRYDEAILLARDALAKGFESSDLLRALGLALHLAGKSSEALDMLDRAVRSRPALALSDKAVILSQLGRLPEACQTFDQALVHQPIMIDAWYNKANAKTFTAGDADIDAMQRLLEGYRSHREQILLHFALGKAHMDVESPQAAFAHWHQGNRMKRAMTEYDAEVATRQFASIAARPLDFAAAEHLTGARLSDLPVFVIGMPRCGSSLVEQILASHPEIHGAGEQTRLHNLFAKLDAQSSDPAAPQDEQRCAESAVEVLRRFSTQAQRIVDKDLRNFLHLGTIHRIFPHARMIHCRRNPLDTCFSAYTKLFLGDFPFTYDLRELGLYYRNYRTLMAHWRAVLPSRIFMELDYETLVSEPLDTTRRLLDFLGLRWSDACMHFFETSRTVNTASFAEVRQPIYRSSVGRSAAILSELQPLIEALGDLPSSGSIAKETDHPDA
jgi:tetratricopeptide (TPR) repeat protein